MARIFPIYNGLEIGTGEEQKNRETKGIMGCRRRCHLVHGLAVYHRFRQFNLVENHPRDCGLAVVPGAVPAVTRQFPRV
jgi:hypothetical protein